MKSLLISLLCLLGLVRNVVGDETICASACQDPFNYVRFAGDPVTHGQQYGLKCYNLLRAESVYTCMRSRCTQNEIKAGLGYLVEQCSSIFPFSVIDGITEDEEASWPQLVYTDLSSSGNKSDLEYTKPALVSDSLYQLSYKTIANRNQATTDQEHYGYAIYGFWGGVVLIGLLNRLYTLFMMWLSRDGNNSQKCPNSSRPTCALRKWIRRRITTPALFGYHCADPLGYCTIPPRLQSWAIMAYLILNVVLCAVSYHTFKHNLNLPTKRIQILHYVGDRCGFMALSNLPVVWIFAMRNDVLIWLTGWSYSTYNLFHRWVARIATLEALIHGIMYTVMVFVEGGKSQYYLEWKKQFWWMGVISLCSMALLCGFSIKPIRKHIYEFFLLFHIVFAVLLLVVIYHHVKVFDVTYKHRVWPCVAVWSLDRLCRIIRIVSLNFLGRKSMATFNSEADTVSLEVPVRSWLRPQPGNYYFIYLIHGTKPWESHPFTLSSWSLPSSSEWEAGSNHEQTTTTRMTKVDNLSLYFLIRPHRGFTKRLRDLVVAKNQSGTSTETGTTMGRERIQAPVRVLVEGPYGNSNAGELRNYKTIIFVIGGSGITVALAYFRALFDTLKESKPIQLQQINLVWAVRDAAMFEEAFAGELGDFWRQENLSMRRAVKLQIELYISDFVARPQPKPTLSQTEFLAAGDEELEIKDETAVGPINPRRSGSSSTSSSASSASSTRTRPHHDTSRTGDKSPVGGVSEKVGRVGSELPQGVNVTCHQPDINEIVTTEARTHASNGQEMAIVCCGPSRMADDTRAAVVSAMDKGYDIRFFPELFSW